MDIEAPTPDPQRAVTRLLGLLNLEEVETDLFRSQSTDEGWIRVYGGQVVAQALMAASRTVEQGRLCHSLHSYFIRPGVPKLPIVFKVERDRDGASFTTRRIVAIQKGRPIFNMAASFQVPEDGLEHAITPPSDVPHPDGLESDPVWARRNAPNAPEPWRTIWLTRERPLDVRAVESDDDFFNPQKRPPQQRHWVRLAAPLTPEQAGDPVLQRCLFAYASDMTLLGTATLPHGISWLKGNMMNASLDHAIWFHDDFRADEWLLYVCDSPWAGRARGFTRGRIFARDGRLLANVAQEGLIRPITPKG